MYLPPRGVDWIALNSTKTIIDMAERTINGVRHETILGVEITLNEIRWKYKRVLVQR